MKITLHSLPKLIVRPKKRLGRGEGSGKAKTSGRGTKGQKARGAVRKDFEGGQLPLSKRLPLYRGKGRNKVIRAKAYALPLGVLNNLPEKETTVTIKTVLEHGLVDVAAVKGGVKIVAGGTVDRAFTISLPITKGALKKVQDAGGSVA